MEVEYIKTYCRCKQKYHLKDARFCSYCGTEIGLPNGFATAEERDAFLLEAFRVANRKSDEMARERAEARAKAKMQGEGE